MVKYNLEELKLRVVAIKAKMEKHYNGAKQLVYNRLFKSNQKKLFQERERQLQISIIPDAEGTMKLWGKIWDQPEGHNVEGNWPHEIQDSLRNIEIQE